MARPGRPWWRESRSAWYATIGGRMTNLNVTDPHDFAAALVAWHKLTGGATPPPSPAPPPDEPERRSGTVAALVPAYVESRRGEVSEKSRHNLRCMLGWLVRGFGAADVSAVSAKAVERAAAGEEWTAGTRMMYLTAAQQFLRWCGRERFTVKKPTAGSRGAEAVLTDDEFAKLLAAARGDFGPMLRFMRATLCRPGEARAVTAEAVNWSAGVVELKRHKTAHKGKRRVILLSPAAVVLLDQQRARHGGGHLFRDGRGRAWTDYAVVREMARTRKRAGVRGDVVAYCVRHTGATRALEAGKSDSDVAAILGHAGTAMLHRHYNHSAANTQRLRGIVSDLDQPG